MASSGVKGSAEEGLSSLHERLQAHFGSLRDLRAEIDAPVFALEHGLTRPEIRALAEQVGAAVREGRIPFEAWLPLVVYASEVGYDYSGDEYWQTFEARTPGWHEHVDRAYIRRKFRDFKAQFGGAEPAGPWARNFSIICWPITHAVLPADLQRHLARLLFEYRRALTAELLADPEELGRHLAARAWQTSSRFQYFAQNVALLGRVAAALLADADEQSPYLLDSTLERIVADLSHERLARQWLYGAKSAAARLETRGFLPQHSETGGEGDKGSRLLPAADPALSLQRDAGGWIAFMEIPDLSVLGPRFPEISDELRSRRAVLAGVAGAPIARGRLLYAGQRFRLSEWPLPAQPLLQVEGGEAATNSVLADQCVLSPGPYWLFGVRGPGYATEVRMKTVRPGGEYVLLSEDALAEDLPPWIAPAPVQTGRIRAYELQVPPVLADGHVASLQRLGIPTVAELEVRPAGLVPASWDGQGRAEWLAGERPLLAASCTRRGSKSVWTIDGRSAVVEWPSETPEIFIGLQRLGVGGHEVFVSLLGQNEEPIAEGALNLRIRPPQARPEGGTSREGLMILATPVSPTLTELWDGEAGIEVRGPAGVEAEMQLVLRDRRGSSLGSVEAEARLPVGAEDWAGLFERLLRQEASVQSVYDEVESCEIRVSRSGLGTVALRCERPFAALRWAAGRDGDGPFLRLINHTEGLAIQIELSEFQNPDRPSSVDLDDEFRLRSKAGGLAIASAGSATAAKILPPTVRHFEDLPDTPRLAVAKKSVDGIFGLIDLAARWGAASRPSDPFGEAARIKVLRLIPAQIAGVIDGHQWASLERRMAERGDVGEQLLLGAIGSKPNHRALARDVSRWTEGLSSVTPEERVESVAISLAAHARGGRFRSEDPRFAEYLLRLASAPETLAGWPRDEQRAHLARVLNAPFLIRAARCLVLTVESKAPDGPPATFDGWAWK